MIHYDEGSTYTLSEEYLQQNHLEKIKKDTNVLIKKEIRKGEDYDGKTKGNDY